MAIALLRKIELLRRLPPRELKRILSISRTEDFPAGAAIFNKAEAAHHVFVVVGGRVKIFSRSNSRKSKTFAYLKRGDFFGEMAVLEDKGRSASAQAVEDSRLLILHKRDLKRLLLSDARLCFFLLQTVSRRLRKADEEIEGLLFKNILGRVAKILYDLGRQSGKRIDRGLLLKDRYTHQELADMIGTTREPLSRALAALRRADLLASRGGALFLRDTEKLESLIQTAAPSD